MGEICVQFSQHDKSLDDTCPSNLVIHLLKMYVLTKFKKKYVMFFSGLNERIGEL